ncbi:MAG TPA: 2-amino-4-hydroxy-6-hydroxymethyldihydropteridine diphosphokinase [Pseudomonadales bacterium]|nr:2-amino-4-hydroxy-6-hydroxymethyldihydropteridine diphosphokinase [Pseudomonadales bacterium]
MSTDEHDAPLALVGLGANLGEARATLEAAVAALRALATRPEALRCSSFWRSAPVDCPPGSPDFVNAVAAFPHDGDPQALLAALLAIEAGAGRVRSVRNAPRALDLDLLLFGDMILDTPRLQLPHPRAHLRAFVLVPAAEIVPELPWPGLDARVADLRAALGEVPDLRRLDR